MEPADFYLVIDLEATCDDKGAVPRDEMEIIEIGAVLVDAGTLQPVDELGVFVRPAMHPTLTPFCTQLTSITQAQVDGAPPLPEALDLLQARLMAGRSTLFCSWGAFDRVQFERDCARHGVPYPFGAAHLNLKKAFSHHLGTKRRFGMAGALAKVGLALEGTHHRGIDDARNIARLLPWCLGRVE
ncbi:MAG: exonuclease domain-containing protein [Alphaproteobacteria bacterium]|nr:exonuclease domain-containing protein [Alphaproteobacteria bacterium]